MDLPTIAILSEIIAAVAVLVSLMYLSIQVRQAKDQIALGWTPSALRRGS